MKIFMSWSGDQSKKIAELVKNFLDKVVQLSHPFISSRNIELGSLWHNQVIREANETNYGLLFITPESRDSPWLHFEAGMLLKDLEKDRIVPILFGIKISEIIRPLSDFHSIEFDESSFFDLVSEINKMTSRPLEKENLKQVFDSFYNKLSLDIEEVISSSDSVKKIPIESKVDELIDYARGERMALMEISSTLKNTISQTHTAYDRLRGKEESYRLVYNQMLLNSYKKTIDLLIDLKASSDQIEAFFSSVPIGNNIKENLQQYLNEKRG